MGGGCCFVVGRNFLVFAGFEDWFRLKVVRYHSLERSVRTRYLTPNYMFHHYRHL